MNKPHLCGEFSLTCALGLWLSEPRYSLPLEQHQVCAQWLHPSVSEHGSCVCIPSVCSALTVYRVQDPQKLFCVYNFCPVLRPAGCTRKTESDRLLSLCLLAAKTSVTLQVCALLAHP